MFPIEETYSMAGGKGKRRLGAMQVDKQVIATVKKLKERGILSKAVKLHGGRYVSRRVAKKAFEFQHAAALNYKAIPVSKAVANKARAEGFTVVAGNRVLSPPDRKWQNRIKRGELAGVKPVKGGYMEAIALPHSIFDIRTLYNRLATGELDKLKLEGEEFAFAFHEHFSYRTFKNTAELLHYLSFYKSIFDAAQDIRADTMGETFKSLQLYKISSDRTSEYNLDGAARKKLREEREAAFFARMKTVQDRREGSRGRYYKRLEKMHPDRVKRELKRKAVASAAYRETVKADPEKEARAKEKARLRAKKSYAKRKNK